MTKIQNSKLLAFDVVEDLNTFGYQRIMDTSKMRLLPKMNSAKSFELLEIGHDIRRVAPGWQS